jgi:hypothetical protein
MLFYKRVPFILRLVLGQILTFSGVGPNPGSRPTLVHPTKPKYQKEHNLPGPIETTWAQSVATGLSWRPKC